MNRYFNMRILLISIFIFLLSSQVYSKNLNENNFGTNFIENDISNNSLIYQHWTGTINNKEADLAYALQENTLIGELLLKNNNQIFLYKVIGMVGQDNEILFNVYDQLNICSIKMSFTGRIEGKKLDCFNEATQTSFKLKTYKGKDRYNMNRIPDAYCSPFKKSIIYYFKADDLNLAGLYSFYQNDSNFGKTDVTRSGKDWEIVNFEIDCTKNQRQALTYGKGLPNNQNKIRYHLKYDTCNYEYEISFYSGFLIIRTIKGSVHGCFGANASIDGIYVQEPSVG